MLEAAKLKYGKQVTGSFHMFIFVLLHYSCLMHGEEEKGEGQCLLVMFTRLYFFRINVCLLMLQHDTN